MVSGGRARRTGLRHDVAWHEYEGHLAAPAASADEYNTGSCRRPPLGGLKMGGLFKALVEGGAKGFVSQCIASQRVD